jgi:cytochrome P450
MDQHAAPESVNFDDFEEIRKALYHPALSRTLDRRSFEDGNPRAGILSLLHGDVHRQRRRFENTLFRRQALVEYEQELFPKILAEILDREAVGAVDLFHLAGSVTVVLAARRAGVDHDGSGQQLADLFEHVKVIAQAAAIHDIVGDKDKVQAETIAVLENLDRIYVTPSRQRREALLDAGEDAPYDLLSEALRNLGAGDDMFADHALLVREVALFLHGGSHTSAQTVCNVFYFLLGLDGTGPRTDWLHRVAASRLDAQKAVHETLRLIPTTPEFKRYAEEDGEVAGCPVHQGARVALDARTANRDPELFGERPEVFDPDRRVRDDVPLWGHSFGAGPHICIGRSVAGGLPLTGSMLQNGVPESHLYGLIALMVQEIAARGVRPHPDHAPERDDRTSRGSRWMRFPVTFPEETAGSAR